MTPERLEEIRGLSEPREPNKFQTCADAGPPHVAMETRPEVDEGGGVNRESASSRLRATPPEPAPAHLQSLFISCAHGRATPPGPGTEPGREPCAESETAEPRYTLAQIEAAWQRITKAKDGSEWNALVSLRHLQRVLEAEEGAAP